MLTNKIKVKRGANMKKFLLAVPMMMCVGSSQAALVKGSTADVTFNLTVQPPSCTVQTPGSVSLGSMKIGQTKENTAMSLTVNCDVAVPTALSASIVTGTKKNSTTVALMNGSSESGATLQLLDSGNSKQALDLTGASSDLTYMFCKDSATQRTCKVIPKVTTRATGSFAYGAASAALRFTIYYS